MKVNDEHIETIARPMMRWVKIEDVGDTDFLVDDQALPPLRAARVDPIIVLREQ